MLRLFTFVLLIAFSFGETFKNSNLYIYHLTPVLHVPVSGIDAHSLMDGLKLVISAVDQSPLKENSDYTISAGEGELVLKLMNGRRWADTSDEEKLHPIPLMLQSATMGTTVKTKLLSNPVVLAQVLPTPFVGGNAAQIHCTDSANISVLTYSTIGARKVELEFKTPLKRHIDYELTSSLPLQYFRLMLQLKEGRSWKTEDTDSNLLTVMSIDTGAGPWQLGGGKGVVVAYMDCPPRTKTMSVVESSVKPVVATKPAAAAAKPGEVLTVYSSTKSKTVPVTVKDIQWVVEEAPKAKSTALKPAVLPIEHKARAAHKDTAHSTTEVLEEYLEVEQPKVVEVVHGDQHNAHHATTSDKRNNTKIEVNNATTTGSSSTGNLRKKIDTAAAEPEYVLSLPRTNTKKTTTATATVDTLESHHANSPVIHANVTVTPMKNLIIYDNSPRISFQLHGLRDVPVEDIVLSLGDRHRSRLMAEVDYMASKRHDSDEMVLYLLYDKQWGFMTDKSPPQSLVLYSVKVVPHYKIEGSSIALAAAPNLLAEPVKLVTVLAVPDVIAGPSMSIRATTPQLNVTVIGCSGAKRVKLVFFPQLLEDTDYVDVTQYPLQTLPDGSADITLQLKKNRKWKQFPGVLIVRALNSGAGLVKVNGDIGEFVAHISNGIVESSAGDR